MQVKNGERKNFLQQEKTRMIVYDRLWKTMEEKGITKYYLIAKCGISPSLITRLKRNQSVRMDTINILCNILDCQIEDIAEHIKD